MRTVKRNVTVVSLFAAVALWGCASAPPKELKDARQAYARASAGPAATVVPAELHKARVSLDRAEQSFREDPDARYTRDLAYVAHRKAQLAEVLARQALENQRRVQAERALVTEQGQEIERTRGKLDKTEDELSQAERLRAEQGARLDQEQQARVAAEQARVAAEQKTAEVEERLHAMQVSLASLAAVKEEERGLVITLSGSVLFPSGQATLLGEAQNRLNQVAEALLATKEQKLVIEGHTDSRGTDAYNRDLSQRRAEAVRQYLISRGYEADLIEARGIGESRPIAGNESAEGRANNRRVEIIVEKSAP